MINPDKRLIVAGVNFRKTSLDVRNKFAFTADGIKRLYNELDCRCLGEFFILSTCNRTEIYSTTENADNLLYLLSLNSGLPANKLNEYCFVKSGDEAIKHLFRVASGLESQILGDYEIIGQLKNAFNLAKAHNRTNGYMEKLFNASLQTSRQIKNRTAISDGTTSVSYAAIQQLKEYGQDSSPLHVCILGLGKIGTLTLKNLKHYLPQHNITIINRSEVKSQEAASEYKVDFASFENQNDVLKTADVLIVATGADRAIINKSNIEQSKVKLVFDLSVPSNVSADVRKLPGVRVLNIDELSVMVNQTFELRKKEVPLAETIIEEYFEEFRQWEIRRKQYQVKDISVAIEQADLENDSVIISNYNKQKSGTTANYTDCNENERTCTLASQCCKN